MTQDKPWPKRTTPIKDMPLTRVVDLDNPDAPPRLIRLDPDFAVMWCHLRDMGIDMTLYANYQHLLYRTDNGWVCGRYWAQDLRKEKT